MEEFKQRQRAMWAEGDYPSLSELISGMGELVADRAAIEEGTTLLDVAPARATRLFRPRARALG